MNFKLHPPHENDIKFAQDNDIEIEIGTNGVEIWHRCPQVNDGLSIVCHNNEEVGDAIDSLHGEFISDAHPITLED